MPSELSTQFSPQEVRKKLPFTKKPVLALALGSGATRGFAHVGVLNGLYENGIVPDLIVGTSAGSVTGALFAGGIRGQKLEDIANQLQRDQIADWSYTGRGVIRGELLQSFVNDLLKKRPIEALEIPFAATATELHTGKLVVFTRGDAGLAVRTSSSIPGLVTPVTINGRDYVDGGVVSTIPVIVAKQLGADIVIAVDVSRPIEEPAPVDSTLDVIQQSFNIMHQRISKADLEEAELIIRPKLGDLSFGDFNQKQDLIEAGKDAARNVLPEIKRLLGKEPS